MRKHFTTGKGRVCVGVVIAVMLSGQPLEGGTIWDSGILAESVLRAAINGVKSLVLLPGRAHGLPLRADGGGDGGDGGGTGDGGSSSDDSGSGSGTDGNSASTDGPAADPSADPDAAPTTVAIPNVPTDPTDPTPTLTPELNAIMSIPTTDPRGGAVPTPLTTTDDALGDVTAGAPGVRGPGGVLPAPAPVNVGIHAVIVSGAMTPWDAVGKGPGVGTVTVTGGIVALGTTPIPGEPPGGGPQPSWLRLVPDLNLLNGSVIPPVVPNVIDIRITRYSFEAVEQPDN